MNVLKVYCRSSETMLVKIYVTCVHSQVLSFVDNLPLLAKRLSFKTGIICVFVLTLQTEHC